MHTEIVGVFLFFFPPSLIVLWATICMSDVDCVLNPEEPLPDKSMMGGEEHGLKRSSVMLLVHAWGLAQSTSCLAPHTT